MLIKNSLFIILQIFCITLTLKIHILRQEDLEPKNDLKQINSNEDSKFYKVCKNILTTYHNIGKQSFDLYGFCKNKYELLGSSSEIIKNENPFCYTNMHNFFCNIRVTNLDETDNCDDKPKKCIPKELTEQVLSILKEGINNIELEEKEKPTIKKDKKCEKDEKPNQAITIQEPRLFKCPSLENDYKISDIKLFCEEAEKIVSQVDDNKGTSIDYIKLLEKDRKKCEDVVKLYNTCIDADNSLFPESNYDRCFSQDNMLYMCSGLDRYESDESKICSDYVLPVIATRSLTYKLNTLSEDYCWNFENKIINEYDKALQSLSLKNDNHNSIIGDVNSIIDNLKDLEEFAEKVLEGISQMNKNWLKFYPDFSSIYKLRSNLTENEYNQLDKLRILVDGFYPYSAGLDKLIRDDSFNNVNFYKMTESMSAYLSKTENYSNQLISIITDYGNILEENQNLTDKSQFMIQKSIMKEEVLAFQNEYIQIINFNKNFLSYIINKIKESRNELKSKKEDYSTQIEINHKYIKDLQNQKDSLYNIILK